MINNQENFFRALQFQQAGDLQNAKEIYLGIISKEENYVAYHNLGTIALKQGNEDEGLALVLRSIEINPQWAMAYFTLARFYRARGSQEAAIENYQRTIRLQPDLIPAYEQLGQLYQQTGKLDEAVSLYKGLIEVLPGKVEGYIGLSLIQYSQKKFEEAILNCEKALELVPNNPDHYNMYGSILLEAKKFPEAIDNFEKTIQLKPDSAYAYYNIGNILSMQKEFPKALEYFKKAVEIQPDFPEAYYAIGWFYLNKVKNRHEALPYFKKVVSLKPDSPEAQYNLGRIFMNEPDGEQEALFYLEETIFLNPDFSEAHATLSILLKRISCKENNFKNKPEALQKLPETNVVRNIIFLRTDAIGDNIIASSALKYIRGKYPLATITVVCKEHLSTLFEYCPYVDNILPFHRGRCFAQQYYLDNIIRQIQEIKADLLINTLYSREELSEILVAYSEAKTIIGFEGDFINIRDWVWDIYKPFYSILVPTTRRIFNELEGLKALLEKLDINTPVLKPEMWLSDEDEEFARQVFSKNNLDPESTIALFVSSLGKNREYDKFETAISKLCRENNISVIALGGAPDFETHQKLLDNIGVKSVNLTGVTLRQSAAVIRKVRLNVGIETGYAHMACAFEVPNLILLSGIYFGRFLPNAKFTSAVCLPLECYGCNNTCKYSTFHCIRNISESVVAEAFKQVWENPVSEKLRIFVQDQSLWPKENDKPEWMNIEEYFDTENAEVIYLSEL